MKVGIVGLGIIGAEVAQHLEADGALAATWNRTHRDAPKVVESLREVAQASLFIHLFVADPAAVRGVIAILAPYLSSEHTVIQSSTIDPASAEEFEATVRGCGAQYVEAPFTGSLPAAKMRELVFYLGGEDASRRAAREYLSTIAKRIIDIGTVRQSSTLKLVMNLQIASALEALAEALTTARKAGVTDDTFFEAFKVNASYSGVAALKESKLRNAEYSPQFSVKHMAKDLRLLQGVSNALPVLNLLVERYAAAQSSGLDELDVAATIRLLSQDAE